MGIEITIRTNSNISYFQKNLRKLIETKNTDTLLLSSGFFQQSILEDKKLVSLINKHCAKLILIGAQTVERNTGDQTYNNYRHFARYLVCNTKKVNISIYMAKEKKWHGKIALKIDDKTPLVGIAGSSNLTEPAYSDDCENFNYETDVLIWAPEVDDVFSYSTNEYLDSNDIFPPMITELKEGIIQKNEKDRLKGLYDIIMNGSILEPVNFFSVEEDAVIGAIKAFEQNTDIKNFVNCIKVINDNAQKLSFQCCDYVRVYYINPVSNFINSNSTINNERKTKIINLLRGLEAKLKY
ncbi:hypothetical protein BCY92_03680 [Bacillus wiedmannii]|uniref:restriction endonuclease PLD domain-containing protein n=1 Tax=Bacillus wiedmannii TaxID=1890302 RepID=UPI000FF4D9A9|nr:hypothetical protein BCY92_03680 [Bacillus wiedmannii]